MSESGSLKSATMSIMAQLRSVEDLSLRIRHRASQPLRQRREPGATLLQLGMARVRPQQTRELRAADGGGTVAAFHRYPGIGDPTLEIAVHHRRPPRNDLIGLDRTPIQ